MKFLKYIALLTLIPILVIVSLGFIVPEITVESEIDVRVPIRKAYNDISSHNLKPILYSNIDPEKTKITPTTPGNTSQIYYKIGSQEKAMTEKYLLKDSLKQFNVVSTMNKYSVHSEISFIDKGLKTGLRAKEKIKAHNFINQALFVLMKNRLVKARQKWYEKIKTAVESTPDFSIQPRELK